MALKQVSRSATVAFAPMAQVIACGTMAGAIDLSFSSSACLELFKLDFTSGDLAPPLIGTAPSTEPFQRLTWGTAGMDTNALPYGIIAGGLADGSVTLYNPAKMMSGSEDVLIKKLQKHTGPVKGLEFNVFTPTLLATGAGDGELCIWDITNPSTPSLYPALKGAVGGSGGEISFLAWNQKVQHILASTSTNGSTVVWDLKKQKPVISLCDPNTRRRCSTLQWSPEVATQLIVASDDDRSPSLQVWDLRNSVGPIKEFTSHSKGVLAMAWCASDAGLLLSCGKDNRTLCWDTNSGEVLCELPASTNWNFDLQWSPRTPGVLSTSSFDGKVGIYNIESCRLAPTPDAADFAAVGDRPAAGLKRAPKWLKRPVGVSFGFGGKLVSVAPRKAAPGQPSAGGSEIKIHQLVTENTLVSRSQEFEAQVSGGEKPKLRAFCEKKAEASSDADETETWSFLKVLFEEDARRKLLIHLNFSPGSDEAGLGLPEVRKEEEAAVDAGLAAEVTEKLAVETEPVNGPVVVTEPLGSPGDPDDFFDNLQTPATPPVSAIRPTPLSTGPTENGVSSESASGPPAPAAGSSEAVGAVAAGGGAVGAEAGAVGGGESDVEEPVDAEVQRALVVGNYELAVRHCLGAERMADALILARVGGAQLWNSVQTEFMRRSHKPYMKVVAAVVKDDMRGLVASRPLGVWKETLALLCTYARAEEWMSLCGGLGGRLEAAGDAHAAVLCYVCAGDIDKAVDIWSRGLGAAAPSPGSVDALQEIIEKAVVLGLATGQKRVSASLSKLVSRYAELLAGQGQLSTAMEYLALVPPEQASQELAVLRDRIYRSGGVPEGMTEVPAFPFEAQELPSVPIYPSSTGTLGALQSPSGHMHSAAPVAASGHGYYKQDSMGASQGVVSYQGYQPAPLQQPQAPAPQPAQQQFHAMQQPAYAQPVPGVITFVPHMPVQPQQQQQQQVQQMVPQQQPQQQQPPPHYGFQPAAVAPPPGMVPMNVAPPPPAPTHGMAPQQNPPQPTLMVPAPALRPIATSVPGSRGQFVPVGPPPMAQVPAPMNPMGQVQPMSPVAPPMGAGGPPTGAPAAAAAPPPPAAAPPAPPPTVQTVDTSTVAGELRPAVSTLTRLYNETAEAMGGAKANAAKKREIEDNSRKLGALFARLAGGDVSPAVAAKLSQLCQALDAGNFPVALQIQVALTTSDWDECSAWLTALKRMMKLRQTLR